MSWQESIHRVSFPQYLEVVTEATWSRTRCKGHYNQESLQDSHMGNIGNIGNKSVSKGGYRLRQLGHPEQRAGKVVSRIKIENWKWVPGLGGGYKQRQDRTISDMTENKGPIWQQYASDIMQKVGNPRNCDLAITASSHPPQYNRQQLTIEDINTLDLNQLFVQIQWQHTSKDDWEKSFNILFPPKGYRPGHSMKDLTTCNYYNNYLELINDIEKQQALDILQMTRHSSPSHVTIQEVLASISIHGLGGNLI